MAAIRETGKRRSCAELKKIFAEVSLDNRAMKLLIEKNLTLLLRI
jgi:hypothetical protein